MSEYRKIKKHTNANTIFKTEKVYIMISRTETEIIKFNIIELVVELNNQNVNNSQLPHTKDVRFA